MNPLTLIRRRLRTQDNRMTADPVFCVEQRRRIYVGEGELCCGEDDSYGHDWMDSDWQPVDRSVARRLDRLERGGDPTPEGYTKNYYIEIWEFVTACFTELGAKEYLRVNGHNLRSPRIYVRSGYRNAEWIAVRESLKGAK